MKNLNFGLVVVSAVLVLSFVGENARADRMNRRNHRQRARIEQGVQSGELTQGEKHRLNAEERRIRRAEKKAKADGVVTDAEKTKIEKMQDKGSRDIYRLKHNEREQTKE